MMEAIIKKLQVPSQKKEDIKNAPNTTVSLNEFRKKQLINWVLKNSKSF